MASPNVSPARDQRTFQLGKLLGLLSSKRFEVRIIHPAGEIELYDPLDEEYYNFMVTELVVLKSPPKRATP